MSDELTGKAAIVTGASRGIGAAAARELAARGVAVLVAARSAGEIEALAAEINASGGKAVAKTADVSRYDDVAALVDACAEAFGRVDILVNNAGVIEPIARIDESDPVEWGQVIDINTKGVYYGLRAVLPGMLAQRSGVVVNISSGAATSALEGWSHYCASKAAALSLTRVADREYRAQGIRVIGLSPGTVATQMQREIKSSGINPVSQLEWEAHISPEWVGRAIAYLCTEEAAEFCGTDFALRDEANRRRVGLVA